MNTDRYYVSENEDYEPGSDHVLKNDLRINDKQIIEALEERELERTGIQMIELYGEDHRFSAQDICDIHSLWLAGIYPFAGKYRSVNMSKDGYHFAAAHLIEKLMNDFEIKFLSKYTPCNNKNNDELARALAIVHVEFIIIHPFREGNGRVARLLANLMALQAGKGFINYALIDKTSQPKGFEEYILGIHQGHAGDYSVMQNIFTKLIAAT